MRTWGRVYDELGVPTWVKVETDANGFNDYVYVTALIQTLKLNLNESPFYADWGIPAQPSVMTQIFPDFYVTLTQQRYQPRFANLTVKKLQSPDPIYDIQVLTHQGVNVAVSIPV